MRMAPINISQTSSGIFIRVMPLHRIVRMVVMRLIPVAIEPKELTSRPRIQ